MALSNVHIGTSGWSYKHWKGIFYPPKLKTAAWLSFYAQTFDTTEINGSFYRMPIIETVYNWTQQVPSHFIFCPKMSRYLTHMKKLKDPEEPLERFFTVFEPMQSVMGPVLVQLPPQLPFHYDTADYFFSLLKRKYGRYAFVLEVRHPTWLHDDSLTLMAKYNIGFVISQSGEKFPYLEMVTATNIYIRMHGPDALYASNYSNELLYTLSEKIRTWQSEGHVVWVYFNNDVHGYAIENAKTLEEMCLRFAQ